MLKIALSSSGGSADYLPLPRAQDHQHTGQLTTHTGPHYHQPLRNQEGRPYWVSLDKMGNGHPKPHIESWAHVVISATVRHQERIDWRNYDQQFWSSHPSDL